MGPHAMLRDHSHLGGSDQWIKKHNRRLPPIHQSQQAQGHVISARSVPTRPQKQEGYDFGSVKNSFIFKLIIRLKNIHARSFFLK